MGYKIDFMVSLIGTSVHPTQFTQSEEKAPQMVLEDLSEHK